MTLRITRHQSFAIAIVLGLAASLTGCGSKEPPAPAQTPAAPPAPVATAPADAAAGAAAAVAAAGPTSWTPEAMEELLAPIALHPDPVLSQMLIASTNPQEVLDAGNWLLQNQGLEGKALDDAAATAGFTPPVRALVQFPEIVDMMCLELGWTTELGQAFTADQAGVLGAVQRLRRQAMAAGNLQSSPQMKVETQQQEGQEVVVLKPAQPQVVAVPQYDPVAVYAPAPVDGAVTTTPVAAEKSGHSTGALVTTGLLSFGAGILVNELFDDDDDDYRHDYYYPNYGHGGMPYYPPYPYRPNYGNGYHPGNNYNRPPGYNSGFNNNTVIINNGGNRPGGGYWDRYDSKPGSGGGYNRPRSASSPISSARPNRPELNELNKRQPRGVPADVKRPSSSATASNWKGQSGYAGAKPGTKPGTKPGAKASPQDRIANASPGYSKPAAARPGTRDAARPTPKVQGSYAGAKPSTGSRDVQRPQAPKPAAKPAARPSAKPAAKPSAKPMPKPSEVKRPSGGQGDRGYDRPAPSAKPAQRPTTQKPSSTSRPSPSMSGGGNQRGSAMSGSKKGGSADRAASQRGKQSLPQGAKSKGGGGGGKKKR